MNAPWEPRWQHQAVFDIGGAISDIIGGSDTQKGYSQADNALNAAAGKATTDETNAQTKTDANLSPYQTAGTGALGQLSSLYGLPGSTATPGTVAGASGTGANASFYLSPDYNFALTQGLKGLTAQGAATNGTNNGATDKAEIQYAGNLASSNYASYKSGLMSLAGMGQSAATTDSTLGQANADSQAGIQVGLGNSLASSYLGEANAQAKEDTGLVSSLNPFSSSNSSSAGSILSAFGGF